MKFLRLLSVVFIFLLCDAAFAAEPPAPAVVPSTPIFPAPGSATPVLPTEFAGWQVKGAVARSDDPAIADAVNAPVLKEYGFQRLEKAAYTRDDGRNLAIKAAVFADASGAYGAFTFYRSAEMGEETIGGRAAFLNNRVLFYQGNVLVDAVFDKMSVMSASQLRELAGLLPRAEGNKGEPTFAARLSAEEGSPGEHHEVHSRSGRARSGRIATAGFAGGLQSWGRGRDRQVHGDCGRCHADAHRISDAADCRGSATPD